MAPRQRVATPPSMDDVRRLLDESNKNESPSATNRTDGSSSAATAPSKLTSASNLPITAADIAREQHDIFNLFALVLVVVTTLSNWDYDKLLHGSGPSEAWTGNYFYLNWATSVLYFLVDLIWVRSVPNCVKSPDTIVKHHMIVIAYLSAPIGWPEYRWFMGACLTVEINTWFLIMRRVVYKRRHQLPAALVKTVSALFYFSWIIIRCWIYPAMLFIFVELGRQKVATTDRLWHWPMVFIPIHFFLCVLNLKWSYDLFAPIVRKWFVTPTNKGDVTGANAEGVSSGL